MSWIIHTLGFFLFLWGCIFISTSSQGKGEERFLDDLKCSGFMAFVASLWISLTLYLGTF